MKVGSFNIHDYLDRLYEGAEGGGPPGSPEEGMVIPDINKGTYDWLKGIYHKGQTEAKVEMTSAKFEPGYSTEGAQDFKPGLQTSSGQGTVSAPPDRGFPSGNENVEGGNSSTPNKQSNENSDKDGKQNKKKEQKSEKNEEEEGKKPNEEGGKFPKAKTKKDTEGKKKKGDGAIEISLKDGKK